MARFHIDRLDELCRQLPFSPVKARTSEIQAAEELLDLVEPNRAYPLDFVIFKITGYRPKNTRQEMLAGAALQHDLGLLIERTSATLDLCAAKLPEPVLAICDLGRRLGVTSKTIQRWRRRGLAARILLFADGKRRVGFFLSSVERFLYRHAPEVSRTVNLSPVSPAEQREILRRARRLATACRCTAAHLAARIARRLDRSPLAILEILRKHDEENPAQAIAPLAAPELTEPQKAQIVQGRRSGLTLWQLARRLGTTRATVARALVQDRVRRLGKRKVRFIDDPLYHQDGAAAALDQMCAQDELATAPTPADTRLPRDLPPYLQELYRTPLLSPARERALFLKFNYEKYRFVAARRRVEVDLAPTRHVRRLESLLAKAQATKNQIVRANLRLVVSVARKHLRPGLSLMELVSEGNLTLLRAVESFDVHRGHRFSTYATLALMKGFARSVPMMDASHDRQQADIRQLDALADPRMPSPDLRLMQREQVNHLLGKLDGRERRVLEAHFGLEPPAGPDDSNAPTPLGLSRRRIGQIQRSALAKLRARSASDA